MLFTNVFCCIMNTGSVTSAQCSVLYFENQGASSVFYAVLGMFRIARAEWSQCRRCQALGSWGSGKLERVGQLGEGWGK
jgi:hypothetical protein